MINCSKCNKEIDMITKRNRHKFLFCGQHCLESYQKDKIFRYHKSKCSRCLEIKFIEFFEGKEKKGYWFYSEICRECILKKRIKKVVINLLNTSETLVHTGVADIQHYTNHIIINSSKDGKSYLYPLMNLLKVEIIY